MLPNEPISQVMQIVKTAIEIVGLTGAVATDFYSGLLDDDSQTIAGMMHCLHVAGRPSQFVGVVTTYRQAVAHLDQLQIWLDENPDTNKDLMKKDSDLIKPLINMLSFQFHESVDKKRKGVEEIAEWRKTELERIRKTASELTLSWENYSDEQRMTLALAKRHC